MHPDVHAPLLLPFAAYRRDREAAGKDEPFGPHDGAWLVIASFLDNIGILPLELRGEVLLSQARVLTGYARAAGTTPPPSASDHPLHWAAVLGAALAADSRSGAHHPHAGAGPEAATYDAAARVAERMAGAMLAVGMLELARVVLEATHRALPSISPAAMVTLTLQRARVVALSGNEDEARQIFTLARNVAADAGLRDLVSMCEGERSLIPTRRATTPKRRRPSTEQE